MFDHLRWGARWFHKGSGGTLVGQKLLLLCVGRDNSTSKVGLCYYVSILSKTGDSWANTEQQRFRVGSFRRMQGSRFSFHRLYSQNRGCDTSSYWLIVLLQQSSE